MGPSIYAQPRGIAGLYQCGGAVGLDSRRLAAAEAGAAGGGRLRLTPVETGEPARIPGQARAVAQEALWRGVEGAFACSVSIVGQASATPQKICLWAYEFRDNAGLEKSLDGSTLDLSKSKLFRDATSRLDTLELSENFALRLGELSVRGWRIKNNVMRSIQAPGHNLVAGELEPAIEQKGVDLRIGLDIARLALRQLVDVIVVVSGDSDIIPAFKFARRKGLRVFLHSLGGSVKRDLEAHADVVLG